ncbi:trp operon leader peptide [Streptomyces parvulus]
MCRGAARACSRVCGMFAHSTQTCQTWWWTAHPAAR